MCTVDQPPNVFLTRWWLSSIYCRIVYCPPLAIFCSAIVMSRCQAQLQPTPSFAIVPHCVQINTAPLAPIEFVIHQSICSILRATVTAVRHTHILSLQCIPFRDQRFRFRSSTFPCPTRTALLGINFCVELLFTSPLPLTLSLPCPV